MRSSPQHVPSISAKRRVARTACDIVTGLEAGRLMARAWGASVPERQQQQAAWAFIKAAIEQYADTIGERTGRRPSFAAPVIALTFRLEPPVIDLARVLGREVAELPIEHACYQLSTLYTALVPATTRSALGMYYTPPALTQRLLDLAQETGIDWRTATVLDPACGGGAFLLPVALRKLDALHGLSARRKVHALGLQLRGFEIDPFAAWLTQTWLEIACSDLLASSGLPMPIIVKTCDTLGEQQDGQFDLVVGNPPYGRVTLTPERRRLFSRSLYGHANLYGVFTDVALRWCRAGGVIAYVTPTSFLGGEYFKALRGLLSDEAPPAAIDFIDARRGVFEDVLQETLLATYRKGACATGRAAVHYVSVQSDTKAAITHSGTVALPSDATQPWLAPRVPTHQRLIERLARMPDRLGDWGYRVSTGPLVWNRFKTQLRARPEKNAYPLIWAEAVTAAGTFVFRAEKRNHQPYFLTKPGDEWLKVETPCVLVQRTTAKEQARRLIAAELPQHFIARHGAVVVENHLNMVRPATKVPPASAAVVAAVLNSTIVDEAFRCISGSVAVSAFELESLPLPSLAQMRTIQRLIEHGAPTPQIDAAVRALYLGEDA
jgi:adenine-specific DNA-methyltransferase